MPTNFRDTIPRSELSRDRWPGEPLEPPPHPAERKPAARVRRFDDLVPLARMGAWFNQQPAPIARVWSWLGERVPLTRIWSSLAGLAPLAFAKYLAAFFIGVIATVVWQSNWTKGETLATAPAALLAMRQSIDKLAAEVTRIRAVEQDILDRISASPPQPVANPARSPAPRVR
jgi:hypothetical protein